MDVDANRPQPGLSRHLPVETTRLLQRNAELVDVQPCRDVRVRAGVDIGIDAHGDVGADASRLRGTIDALQLPGGLGVDRFEAELHGPLDFLRRLSHAAEHDVGRRKPGAHGELDLADGIGIDRTARFAQQAHQRERRVRLHGIVDPMRVRRERGIELGIRVPD